MKKQLLLLLATFGVLRLSAQNATQVNVGATATSSTITNNVATAVDPNLTVTANGNINGFIVSISDSYTSGDVLSYTGTLPSGVTAVAFNTTTRSLVFNGSTSAANWQALLRTVTLQTTSATCFPESRKVSFNAGNKYYNALNGHFYEYYSTAQTWLNAKAYAATQSYFGREGYLATATSLAENNFIWKIIGNDVWIGASYDYNELTACGVTAYANQAAAIGNTYWVTGPEKGTYISSGLGTPVAQNNQFANWNNGEPNNSGNEYYVELYVGQNGKWNDLGAGSTLGALIEYGGMPNDNTTSTVVATRTVLVSGAPSGTVSGGNVTVCSGTNSTTLTLGGFTGSVVRWESSVDNFLTTPTTINSTSTSYTAANLTQTTYYRAIVNTTSPATCSSLNTSSTPVNVTATVTGNINAANSSICPNSQASLTLFGNNGNILKWQVSTSSNFSSGVTDISNTTNNLSYTLASAGTYYFRAQVQASGCGTASFSPSCTVTVTAGTPPVGGTVTSTEHCAGSNSGTLTLSGYSGTISKWQYSTDGIIWTDVANTTATLSYTGVTTTRQYRAVLTNGSCGSVNSAIGTVTVYGNTAYQWLGTTNTASSTATNWKCSTTPPTGVDVVISSTASNDLVLDQSYSFGNVDMSNSTRNIILGNYDLTVTSITGANASHYIKTTGTGKLKIAVANGSSISVPVGNSAYNPVTITNNTGAADNFAIKIYDEVYQYGTTGSIVPQAHVKRTWDISKTNPNGGSGISFVFNWNAGETSAAMTTPVLYHYGPTWSKQTGTTSVTSTSLTYSNYLGTFSPFVVAEGSGYPLPITWVSFTANKQGKTAVLSWTTANEKNTKDYTIQRSTNGNNWENIGTQIATGNLSMAQKYDYTDQHPVNGNNYYRILQADIDGSTTYSSIARINFAENGHQFSVYPNPVVNGLLHVTSDADATVVVYNNMGMKVYEQEIKAGTTQLTLPSLAHGVYLIKAGDDTASFVVE